MEVTTCERLRHRDADDLLDRCLEALAGDGGWKPWSAVHRLLRSELVGRREDRRASPGGAPGAASGSWVSAVGATSTTWSRQATTVDMNLGAIATSSRTYPPSVLARSRGRGGRWYAWSTRGGPRYHDLIRWSSVPGAMKCLMRGYELTCMSVECLNVVTISDQSRSEIVAQVIIPPCYL
jgi:hypothetical protein